MMVHGNNHSAKVVHPFTVPPSDSSFFFFKVEAGITNSLDFGDLPYGSWKALPLKLTNKTCARLPIRLVIHAVSTLYICTIFCPFMGLGFMNVRLDSLLKL